ncbi:MAG: penicillin-binding protein 2, partial [Lysobacteraceae bacterium]
MRTPGRPMRNPLAEAAVQRRRALVAFLAVFALLAVLAGRFAWLQVFSYEEFHTRSEANRIKARPIVPARGLIYDRAGRILADNVPAYRLDVVREDAGDLDEMVARLREVIDLDEDDARAFIAAARARRSFQPVTVKLRLSDIEVARFAVNRHRFPGVEVVPYLNRHYPHGELFAHVVGYVGRIDTADLARVDPARYSGATHIGKTGIERYYESRLHGQVG